LKDQLILSILSILIGYSISNLVIDVEASIITYSQPWLIDNERYKINLFFNFSAIEGLPKVFQLTISNGSEGFPAGMYITSGPTDDERSDRLFFINKTGNVSVFASGFKSNEALIFAKYKYGHGILVTEPLQQHIQRVLPNGISRSFTTLGTAPFGPAVMTFGPDDFLYVTDPSSNNILRVYPDGKQEIFSNFSNSQLGPSEVKGILYDKDGIFGNNFIISTFNIVELKPPQGDGGIYLVSPDGNNITRIVGGLDGIELLESGPGNPFYEGIFISSIGTDLNADGGVYILYKEPDGVIRFIPFLMGIDATDVVFDTENVLGGGMFVADFGDTPDNKEGQKAGRIWHILPAR
jgi:hypothetical protein